MFQVLTWVSIYAFSTAGPSAAGRIYYMDEHRPDEEKKMILDPIPSSVPIGISLFPLDIVVWPREWGLTAGNVVYYKQHPDGGHFAAHERPEELAQDLKEMYGKGGSAFGVVNGRDGFKSQ